MGKGGRLNAMSRSIEVIAEVANAHQGDPALALKLAEIGFAAGADAVKFQVYFAHELLVRAHPRFEHFRKQSFAPDVWPGLIGAMKAKGAKVYCDVFGVEALEVAASCGADGFKIHAADLGNRPLIEAVAATGKQALLSAGGSTVREIARAVDILARSGRPRPILLHGYQSFPTAVEDSCLERLAWLRSIFGDRCAVGYMDHVDGDDPFAFHLPLVAAGMGAEVIEKHLTLDRAAKGVDYYSSLNPDEFERFVAAIRRTQAAIGSRPDTFTESERSYRKKMKKIWVAARDLPAGHVLSRADMVVKQVPEAPCELVEPEKLLGRPLLAAVAEEQPLHRGLVPNTVWVTVVARMASRRLPGKALADVAGLPAIRHLLERLKLARTPDRVVFCTTTQAEDDPLAQIAIQAALPFHRGPVEDVLGRMLGAMDGHEVDVVVRVTGDDILVDPDYLDRAVAHHLSVNAEYSDLKTLPSGTEVEVFDARLLKQIHALAKKPEDTEYLTFYVTRNGDQVRQSAVPVQKEHERDWRLTIDTPEDYQVISRLLEAMRDQGKALDYRLDDIVAFFEAHPEVLKINADMRKRSTAVEVESGLDWARCL